VKVGIACSSTLGEVLVRRSEGTDRLALGNTFLCHSILETRSQVACTGCITVNVMGMNNLFFTYLFIVYLSTDRLCGLVVSVADYKHRGPGFDSRALLRIFVRELGLDRGPLSLVIG
jgi:hypothetical protein